MSRFLSSLLLVIPAVLVYSTSFAVEYEDYQDVLKSLINPHEQINDEGEVLWGKCIICHPTTPDVDKDKSIEDVKLRFSDNLRELCYRCHPQPMHPGGAWMGLAMGDDTKGSPNHLIEPPKSIADNINLSLKETKIKLPLTPGTGRIFCATCHNPHERGLLRGRSNAGADISQRLRTTGGTICQFCHRK